MSKTVLITGTSTGVGLAAAILFAKKGYKVYASMRNLAKKDLLLAAAQAANVSVSTPQLDVTDTVSVQNCVAQIIAETGKIDILINNAGAGYLRSTEQATEADYTWVTEVNYHGVVRCTKAVLPFMRTAKQGHIINITSVGGLVGQPFNEFYCAAKFAVEGYTEALASYVTDAFGIQFSLVEPGGITTEFVNNVLAQVGQSGGMLEDAYLPILQKYIGGARQRAAAGEKGVFQTADEVAAIILSVAENPNPPLRTRTSDWSNEFCHLKTMGDPDGKKLVEEVKKRFL